MKPCPYLAIQDAATVLARGGIVIYPTETSCALGCRITDANAVSTIFAIKGRALQKPLPLIAADQSQIEEIAHLENAPANLISTFWPGPLTLVLPAKKELAPGLINPQHKVAIRISSSPVAAGLAMLAGACITATSANISGKTAPGHPDLLDQNMLAACVESGIEWGILRDSCFGEIPLPSTLAEPVTLAGISKLRILREGCITRRQLAEWDPI